MKRLNTKSLPRQLLRRRDLEDTQPNLPDKTEWEPGIPKLSELNVSANHQRAHRAQKALEILEYRGGEYAVSDLVADLLHLADLMGWDKEKIINRAEIHHEAERD